MTGQEASGIALLVAAFLLGWRTGSRCPRCASAARFVGGAPQLERRRRAEDWTPGTMYPPPNRVGSEALQEACDRMGHHIPLDRSSCCCGRARRTS